MPLLGVQELSGDLFTLSNMGVFALPLRKVKSHSSSLTNDLFETPADSTDSVENCFLYRTNASRVSG